MAYHLGMGVRRTNAGKGGSDNSGKRPTRRAARRRRGRKPFSAMLLVFAVITVAIVFFVLLQAVRNNANMPRELPMVEHPEPPIITPPPVFEPEITEAVPQEDVAEQVPSVPPLVEAPPPQPYYPYVPRPASPPPAERPARTRDQGIFFVQVADDGADLRLARVSRTLRISDTPLIDSLNALLAGPTAEESARGMVSFIPPDTRILSVQVRGQTAGYIGGDTAYINFNEYFQFNTSGSEGLNAQIQQIVWTVTEFANVQNVQILIEGSRVDFLHGGIRIGSPIGR